MRIARYGKTRYWAVIDTYGALICLMVYKRGAMEVKRRLDEAQQWQDRNGPAEDVAGKAVSCTLF